MNWRVGSRRTLEVGLFLLVAIGLWDALVQITGIPKILLPGPRDVVAILFRSWPFLLRNMLMTMEAVVQGYSLGASLGFILAVLITFVGVIRRALYPLTAVVYVVPKSVFAPLFVLWWGVGPAHKLAVIALIVFFPVMENMIVGLKSADADMVDLSRSLGANKLFTFRKIELPSALPFLLAGLRIGLTEAFIGAIVVEIIVPQGGIGTQLLTAGLGSNTDFLLAGMFVVAVFGITSYVLLERFERRLLFWY